MIAEALGGFAAGLAAGAAGLLPFLHTNTLLEALQGFFADPVSLAVFAAALAGSHAAFEAAPAVFFAVPSANQGVSVLPAHAMARAGKGVAALKTILYSVAAGFALALLLAPTAAFALPALYDWMKPVVGVVLAAAIAAFVLSERGVQRAAKGVLLLALSGALGVLALFFPLSRDPLFALLTGFFCIPALLLSRGENTAAQKEESVSVDLKLVLLGAALGMASTLLPAMTPAVMAAVVFSFMERRPASFLSLVSAIAGSKLAFDFAAAGLIGKARSGAAFAAMEALGRPSALEIILLLAACGAALFAATALLAAFCRKLPKVLAAIPSFTNKFFLAVVLAMVFLYCGWSGLFVAAVAACIGLFAALVGSRRSYCNGSLLVPALLYFTGLNYAVAAALS
ncbi:MAG: tripartite tricarboxylate transporter permease [Candidatus Micrarchaeota archaeon]